VKDIRFLNGIRGAVKLPSLDRPLINKGRRIGRDILEATGGYEEQVMNVIARHQLPQIYPNADFKTGIYKASEPSPCLDEIFYKYENLIPYGKEYWFAIFTAMDKKKNPMQLIVSFGRRNSRMSRVDGVDISGGSPVDGMIRTGAFVWCHDGRKKLVAPTVETMTTFTDRSITSTGDGMNIDISGTVPEYNVRVDSDAIKCDLHLRKPASGYDTEVLNELKMRLNYQVYNLYYDFDGTLNGNEYSGRCYLQKVILSTPLVPWYWSRFVFKDGSSFVFFKPYFGSRDYNYSLRNKGAFYSASEDKLYWVHNIDVKHDAKMRNWKFTSKGEGYSLTVGAKAYADHGFNFRYGGVFNYNEYMVNIKKFDFRTDASRMTLKKLGTGAGIVEDATGLLI
jgi:hypothetical protein